MAIGSNPPNWPEGLDKFMRFETDFDNIVAGDMNDIYECLLEIESELGANPSGDFGSIRSRLFADGKLAKKGKGWRRLEQYTSPALPSTSWDESFSIPFQRARFSDYVGFQEREGNPLVFVESSLEFSTLMGGAAGVQASILNTLVAHMPDDEDSDRVYVIGYNGAGSVGSSVQKIMALFWGLS